MKKHIIALTGFSGVGKDTDADLLVTHFGFTKLAFADALRAEVSIAFKIDTLDLVHPSTKAQEVRALAMDRAPAEFVRAIALAVGHEALTRDGRLSRDWMSAPRTPRQILQWWGTDYRRADSPSYWTRIMAQRMCLLLREGQTRLVITDVRFQNEADTVRNAGGFLWQVTRPGIDGKTTSEGDHISATDGSAFKPSAVIANLHDIRHLQQLVFSEFVSIDSGVKGTRVEVPA